MIRPYVLHPWNYPVPVRPGAFVPFEARHAPYNVVTDPGRVAPFGPYAGSLEPVPAEELLHADFQTTPDYVVAGRLGSGRSGHYRGKYLKGIGRTPLAANWNSVEDQHHATGVLWPSSALGELFASWVAEAKGLSHCLNGCEGLLLAPLDPGLRAFSEASLAELEAKLGARTFPCDRALMAITVKPAGFARFSNFVWLMNNMDLFQSRDALVHFLVLFTRYLDPSRPLSLAEISPRRIAEALGGAVARTLSVFRDLFRGGLYWGTPQNNVAMDGRMLDLDFPYFLGGPLVGSVDHTGPLVLPDTDPVRVVGLAVIGYLYQVRLFVKLLRARLALLPELDFSFSETELDFVTELRGAIDEVLSPGHLLNDPDAAADVLLGWYRDLVDVQAGAWPGLERAVRVATRWRLTRRFDEHVEIPTTSHTITTWHGTEAPRTTLAALFGAPVAAERLEEARSLHEMLASLERFTDRDALFVALEETRAKVKAYVRPI